jgi:hypothetical protein
MRKLCLRKAQGRDTSKWFTEDSMVIWHGAGKRVF